MPFNAKPLILFENVLSRGRTLTATDTDSGSSFSVDNIINQVVYQLWKAASAGTKFITVDLNKISNAGFETGDGTGWTMNAATISTFDPHSGTYHSVLLATGSNSNGPLRNIDIDPTKTYTFSVWTRIPSLAKGDLHVSYKYLDYEGNELRQGNTEQEPISG